MVLSMNRLHCFFLALFLWESANGLGVWQNRPANYWQSTGGSEGPGNQALSPAQQDFSSSASGVQSAAYDVGSAQSLSTSGSGGSATNFLGFLGQYTISSDQNIPTQYSPFPRSQGGYTAQSSVSSGNQPALGFQNQLLSAPVFQSQGLASQSLGSQQSSLQLASPGPVVSSPPLQFVVPGTQTQSSSPGTLGSYGSQSAASSLYGQPPNWYSPSQGQSVQSQSSLYKPVTPSQDSSSQSPASQQGSPQVASPSLSFTTSYVSGAQPLSPSTSSLSSTSTFATTPQQASYGSQSATGMLSGLASNVNPSQSADAPNRPAVVVIGAYTAGPAQWYRVDPFGRTSQTNMPLSPSQASGSQGSQAASSSSLSTSQTQSTTDSVGFGFQSQSAPASTVGLTQSAAQAPSFQAPSGFSSTSFGASSPSASVSQPSQGIQSSVTWTSPGVSTSFGQDIPVAITQQYSRDALQVTEASSSVPSQVPSTSQTSGNYGSTFQSSSTRVGSFDQYGPALSGTFVSAQGTPIRFGLGQDYGTQFFSASGLPQTAVSSSLNQATPEVQGGSSVYGDSLSFSSFERSGSTSYSFAQDLNNPVFKPATRRVQDSSVKH